jgi:hypothetical protein
MRSSLLNNLKHTRSSPDDPVHKIRQPQSCLQEEQYTQDGPQGATRKVQTITSIGGLYCDGRPGANTVRFVPGNAQQEDSYLFDGNVEFVTGCLL